MPKSSDDIIKKYNRRYSDLKYEVKKYYRTEGITITEKQLKQIIGQKLKNPDLGDLMSLYAKKPMDILPESFKAYRKDRSQDEFQFTPSDIDVGISFKDFSEQISKTDTIFNTGASSLMSQFYKFPTNLSVIQGVISALLGQYGGDQVAEALGRAKMTGVDYGAEEAYTRKGMQRFVNNLVSTLESYGAEISQRTLADINDELEGMEFWDYD